MQCPPGSRLRVLVLAVSAVSWALKGSHDHFEQAAGRTLAGRSGGREALRNWMLFALQDSKGTRLGAGKVTGAHENKESLVAGHQTSLGPCRPTKDSAHLVTIGVA